MREVKEGGGSRPDSESESWSEPEKRQGGFSVVRTSDTQREKEGKVWDCISGSGCSGMMGRLESCGIDWFD